MTTDLMAAWRSLWRAKPFVIAATLTLGLGIAGVAVLLTFMNGVLFRPLPVRDQDRVIVAWKRLAASEAPMPFTGDAIRHAATSSRLLETVGGVTSHAVASWVVVDRDQASSVNGALVTGAFFDVLGTPAMIGRALTAADDLEGSEPVMVISDRLWRNRYGASPAVLGRRVTIDELPFTIVGVMPPDSDYPRGAEAWRSTMTVPISPMFGDAARQEINLIARLRPGVTPAQAAGELGELTRTYEQTLPAGRSRGMQPVVRSFEEAVVGNARPVLIALFAAVSLVLLIACANVANLLLMRSEGRRSELAVREALGAGRARLVRQLMAEGAILTVLATVVGLVATIWSMQGLIAMMPDALPRVESIRVDGVVVALIAAIALPVCLLAAAAPAWLGSRLDLVTQLRAGSRGATGASRGGRRALVVAQVALAVMVTAAAGLVGRSLLRLQGVDTGLATEQLWFVGMSLPRSEYADRARHTQFLNDAIVSLQGVPQFSSVTSVNAAPFSGGWSVPRFTAEGQAADAAGLNPPLNLEAVRGNFFETMGVRLVGGRTFTDGDRPGSLDVAIVSDDVARVIAGSGDVVGKRIKMGGPDAPSRWLTIVGVAAPTRYRDLATAQPTLYLPAAQMVDAAQTLAVRTTAAPALVASIARERLRAIDPDVHVVSVTPFSQRMAAPLARPRFNAFLLVIFGAAALLLAGIGQFAVVAAYVRQREREIALRVALGASPGQVRALVFGETFKLTGYGAAIGLAGAVMAGGLLRGLLFDVDRFDPISLVAAVTLLVFAALTASYLPVRRATRVDPNTMLRA